MEPTPAENVPLDAEGKPLSKKALNKLKKEQSKAEAKAKRQQEQQQQQASKAANDVSEGRYGNSALIQSSQRTDRHYTKVSDLQPSLADTSVLLRGRVHGSRQKGNLVFITLRQRAATVQIVASKGPTTSAQMIKFLAAIPSESIVDVEGKVVVAAEPIYGATQHDVELQVEKLFVISAAQTPLPIQIEDAERPQPLIDAQNNEIAALDAEIEATVAALETADDATKAELQAKLATLGEQKSRAQKYVVLSQPVMLDNRIIDLRTTTNQAIFSMQSGVGALFRDFLSARGFVEIHTPKLISAASEGGADVFRVTYFEREAFLAQSPQLYKQMAICADFDRVYEIAPVFRAEKSFTPRHMTEFMGLDFEMAFNEHYHEVLDLIDELFVSIFDGLATRYAREIEVIKRQFPFEDLVYHRPSLRLNYTELIDMLRADGLTDKQYTDDISTEEEKRLGVLVKQKYNSDFYIVDKFPLAVRPFYTMPDPADERFSNSYDIFLRGQEIMSGAQRVHDSAFLEKRAREKGVDISTIQDYIDAFKFGAPPHAGGGIGLERIVMLYLNLGNIRKTSMFPRDPKRLTP